MHEQGVGTGIEQRAKVFALCPSRRVLTALVLSLVFRAPAFAALIDFEQWPYSPAPSGCAGTPFRGPIVVGNVTVINGQLASAVGVKDTSTVYWNMYDCPGATDSSMEIHYAKPASHVAFYLENMETDQPATFFQFLVFNDLNQRFSFSLQLLAPNIRGLHLGSSSTVVRIPREFENLGISRIRIKTPGTHWNYLIDDISDFSLVLLPPEANSVAALLTQWDRLGCASNASPACHAIQANLLRFGSSVPIPTPSCGVPGEPCCDPAAGVPACSAGSTCDSTTDMCVPTCGLLGDPCCDLESGVPPCSAGICDSATATCVPSCGALGGPCCDPASGVPPCSAGSTCDSTTVTCVPSCGAPGEPCCVSPAGASCSAGSVCNPLNNTCQ